MKAKQKDREHDTDHRRHPTRPARLVALSRTGLPSTNIAMINSDSFVQLVAGTR
jgi:hypothetical protein